MEVRLDEVATEKACLLVHVGSTGAWNSSSVQQMSPDDVRNQAAAKEDFPEFECSCRAGRMWFRDTGRDVCSAPVMRPVEGGGSGPER